MGVREGGRNREMDEKRKTEWNDKRKGGEWKEERKPAEWQKVKLLLCLIN
jgi:hypothetical protein